MIPQVDQLGLNYYKRLCSHQKLPYYMVPSYPIYVFVCFYREEIVSALETNNIRITNCDFLMIFGLPIKSKEIFLIKSIPVGRFAKTLYIHYLLSDYVKLLS